MNGSSGRGSGSNDGSSNNPSSSTTTTLSSFDHDDDSTSTQQRRRLRNEVEFNICKRFLNSFQNKLDQIRIRYEGMSDQEKAFQMSEEERKIVMQVNNFGMLEGVVAGVFSFVALRRVRAGFVRRLAKATSNMREQASKQQQTSHIKNSPFSSAGQSSQPLPSFVPNSNNTGFTKGYDPTASRRGFGFNNVFGWIVDAMVSFSVAASVSMYMLDSSALLFKLAQIPLLQGNSKISDEFCPEAIQEYQTMKREFNNNHNIAVADEQQQQQQLQLLSKTALRHPESPYLQALLEFCTNCQKRKAYEQLLRQEQNLDPTTPVTIPSPGVPTDIAIPTDNNDDDDNDDDNDNDKNSNSFWDDSSIMSSSNTTDFYDPTQEK